MLRVSALHYLAGDWVSGGFQTVASAHALHQPTSCGSEYFYNQCPQVPNLIGVKDPGFSPSPYSSHFLFFSIYSSYFHSCMHLQPASVCCDCCDVVTL